MADGPKLDSSTVVLPKGTRVVLRIDIEGPDGFVHRRASLATVEAARYNTYTLITPSGRMLTAERDQITVQKKEVLENLVRAELSFDELVPYVIYAATVGSRAWGLSSEDSDEDVRGAFVVPFEIHTSLFRYPAEIHTSNMEQAYWEIEKLIHQGLKGDANTLETLWSPLVRVSTSLGDELRRRREIFVSMNVLGSFGRYAQSQFEKIERSLKRNELLSALLDAIDKGQVRGREDALALMARLQAGSAKEELKAVTRSLFDRGLLASNDTESLLKAVAEGRRKELSPPGVRPKNAYNLLRLLHSCKRWLSEGEPLIEVGGVLKETLLSIKEQRLPIEQTIALAKETAKEIDELAKTSRLPEAPDYRAADELLKLCRAERAKTHFQLMPSGSVDRHAPTFETDVLPADVDRASLQRFVEKYATPEGPIDGTLLWVALTGAHAYGFPSPDSDLDLKAVHVAPAARLLGLENKVESVDFLGIVDGREYDFTSNELGQAAQLILKGNGNLLERFLGPINVLTTPAGKELRDLAGDSLSQQCQHHYRGFFSAMRREYAVEEQRGERRAKRLLYAYRVALTGIHMLLEGEVETNVLILADRYGFDRVDSLVQRKASAEKATLDEGEDQPYLEDLTVLEHRLADAVERSPLPPEPPNKDAIDAFIIRERLH